jgi:hypothetical protein
MNARMRNIGNCAFNNHIDDGKAEQTFIYGVELNMVVLDFAARICDNFDRIRADITLRDTLAFRVCDNESLQVVSNVLSDLSNFHRDFHVQ